MSTDVTVAVIGLVGSALSLAGVGVSLVWSRRAQLQAQQQAAELEDWKSGRDAERDYEYEARKRLYHELQPLLFQLGEASESAYSRIEGLAQTSSQGGLESPTTSWLNVDEDYRITTIYRLLVPAVFVRLIRRHLTAVDLRLDDALRARYEMAKLIISSWNDGFELAAQPPQLNYTGRYVPTQEGIDAEAVEARQHLVRGQLELALDALTRRDGEQWRCLELAEVIDSWRDSSPLHEHLRPLEELLTSFTPKRRPVFWRLLLCQAILLSILSGPERVRSLSTTIQGRDELERLDWRTRGQHATVSFEQAVAEPLEAARRHLLGLAGRD